MKANPGGQIEIQAVIGREDLVTQIWETIEQQSVIMTAERRIGKTTIIRKMLAEPVGDWTPVFHDLEKCHSATEFAMAVYRDVHQFLSTRQKLTRRAKELFNSLGGTEISGVFTLPPKVQADWKAILTSSIEDLVNERDPEGEQLLFLWDEVPLMLANIRDREGEETAMEVLDVLRGLRQTHAAFRMIITGSIGLHHVLTSLKEKRYRNAPVNDMATIEVLPLDVDDGCELARRLIEGEFIKSPDAHAASWAIAMAADCFPFYIHHIVKALKINRCPADPETVAHVVSRQLVDANDPWELRHYRERIKEYYGPENESAVLDLLDDLALSTDPVAIDALLQNLKNVSEFDDREQLLTLLHLLERDHYLQRDPEGQYAFRFPLLQRWWRLNRGL